MAKTAQEEWEALNRAVNCKHYIGARRWNTINEALVPAKVQPKASAVKPTVKKEIKKAD